MMHIMKNKALIISMTTVHLLPTEQKIGEVIQELLRLFLNTHPR